MPTKNIIKLPSGKNFDATGMKIIKTFKDNHYAILRDRYGLDVSAFDLKNEKQIIPKPAYKFTILGGILLEVPDSNLQQTTPRITNSKIKNKR
jgi:hypothetical protein